MADESKQSGGEPPVPNGFETWNAYWTAQGMPWRTQPEIDEERQSFLAERRAVKADIRKGIYPFRDENGSIGLTRADVEWLLVTHQEGVGPVWWELEKNKSVPDRRSGLDLRGADVRGMDLSGLPLARTVGGLSRDEWNKAVTQERAAARLRMEGANLSETHLEDAFFNGVHLEHSTLYGAFLQNGFLRSAHLEGANLRGAHLEGIRLMAAYFDIATNLSWVTLGTDVQGYASLVDVRWGDANLALVNWAPHKLGEEMEARQSKNSEGKEKDGPTRLTDYQKAVRAYRQLAAVLRSQGLNEDADKFAYRAHKLQTQVFRRQKEWGRAFGSWLLDRIAGYGYKPVRSFLAYAAVILAFMGLYLLNSQFTAPHLSWNEALVLSMSSFHGRGFFNPSISLGDTYAELAAGEAFVGLIIEITFIATFTQRFFAR